jgi:hypothetical protein
VVPGRIHPRPSMTAVRSRKKSDPSHCFDRCSPSGRVLLGHCETDRDSFIVLRPRLRNVITCVYVTLRSISLVGTTEVQGPADGELTCASWLACGNSLKGILTCRSGYSATNNLCGSKLNCGVLVHVLSPQFDIYN